MTSEISIYIYLNRMKQSMIKEGLIAAFPDLAEATLGIYYDPRSGRLLVKSHGATFPDNAKVKLEQIVEPYRREKPEMIASAIKPTVQQNRIVRQLKPLTRGLT